RGPAGTVHGAPAFTVGAGGRAVAVPDAEAGGEEGRGGRAGDAARAAAATARGGRDAELDYEPADLDRDRDREHDLDAEHDREHDLDLEHDLGPDRDGRGGTRRRR